jgi:hypothetical protein
LEAFFVTSAARHEKPVRRSPTSCGIADQRALAEFLSADYDERAEVIYLVTSGYSVNGGPASDLRMKRILSSRDQCLAKGASVIRLQIQPDGPLLDNYVEWVCEQMQAHGTRCLVADVTKQVGLPSMAIVRRKDKSGTVRQTIENVGRGPTGCPARQAVFAWRINFQPNKSALTALIECLDEFARRGASLDTPDKYRQFAQRLMEPHSSVVVKS